MGDSQINRLIRQENLQRLDRGVFLLGAAEPQWASYAWAGVLVVTRSPERRSWARFVREAPGVRSPSCNGQPPRTLVEDTVLDLCAATTDPSEVVHLLTTACLRLTTPARLRHALRRRSKMAHRTLLDELLAEAAERRAAARVASPDPAQSGPEHVPR